jgi:ribonuclease P/MRP protein subunit RPP1
LSSEASQATGVRAPVDVINLATVWGLKQEKARNAITLEARGVVMRADFSKSSYRGVIDVIDGGDPPILSTASTTIGKGHGNGLKRKVEDGDPPESQEPVISKREMKRRAKQAKLKEKEGWTEGSGLGEVIMSEKA